MREESIEPEDWLDRQVRIARYNHCHTCNDLFTEEMVVEHGAMCENCQKFNAKAYRMGHEFGKIRD